MTQSAESPKQLENSEVAKLTKIDDVEAKSAIESLDGIDLNISSDAQEKLTKMGLNFEKSTDWTIKLKWSWTRAIKFDTETEAIKVTMCLEKNDNWGSIIIDITNKVWTTESDIIKENDTNLSINKLTKDSYGNLLPWEEILSWKNNQYLMNKKFDYLNRISSKKDAKMKEYTIINSNIDLWYQEMTITKWNIAYIVSRKVYPNAKVSVKQGQNEMDESTALNILNLSF